MKIIALASQKGGAGKTTAALHLSVAASREYRSALLDLDPQKSAWKWRQIREHQTPEVRAITLGELDVQIETARQGGLDFLFIDTPPHTDSTSIKALEVSDFVLIPVQPSMLDVQAVSNTIRIVKVNGSKAAAVLSRVPHQGNDANDTEAALARLGLSVSPMRIGDRAAFRRSLPSGEAVTEYEPKGKAAAEIDALWAWTLEQIR
mgnify:FL=1